MNFAESTEKSRDTRLLRRSDLAGGVAWVFPSPLWLIPTIAIYATVAWFTKLYLQDKDKRKLMFSIVFILASIDYIFMSMDLHPLPGTILSNIYFVASVPLQMAIFLAVIETLYRIDDFDKAFKVFLGITALLFLSSFLPFSLGPILSPARKVLAIETISISFYSFLRKRSEAAFLFGMSLVCFTTASIGMAHDLPELAVFSFTMAYVFLSLIFRRVSPKEGIESYFALMKRLEETERKLKLSEEKYRVIVECTSDVIMVTDPNGIITYVSPSCKNLFGYDSREFIGKTPWQINIIHPDDVKIVSSYHRSVKENGFAGRPIEFRIITKDRKIKWVSQSISAVKEDGRIVMFISSYRDVTERKEMEQQLSIKVRELERAKRAYLNIMEDLKENIEKLKKAREEIRKKNRELEQLNRNLEEIVRERTAQVEKLLKAKEELLIQISHDIKTPLTPLCTLLPLVREQVNDPKTKRLLDICIKNADYMKKLIADTLQLLKADKYDLKIENINLKKHVEEIVENYKIDLDQKKIRTYVSVGEDIFVRADRIRLREIFDNLISNAIKYSKEGGEIRIGAEKENGMVKIFVRDNGMGMTKEQLEHIFDEFYKADKSGHDLASVGVGLSICKKLVEKHGGKIWAESEGLGKGSTFYFTLPAGHPEEVIEKTIEA